MQIPTTTPVGTLTSLSGADVTLHTLVNVSWHVLLPYTVFGAAVMVYSQSRLLRGQYMLNRQADETAKAGDKQSPSRS